MLSFKIREEISNILALFENAQCFTNSLESITSTFPELIEQHVYAIAVGGDVNILANKLRNNLANTKNCITDVKPISFITSISELRKSIIEVEERGFASSQLNEIAKKLHDFVHVYEAYIDDSYSPVSASKLLIKAKELSPLLQGFKDGLNFYLLNVESSVALEKQNETEELSIELSSQMNLSEFVLKLQSIELIYNELCMLMRVSTSDFPIQIIKIESGSLLAKVLGNSLIIGMMTTGLINGANYIYQNFTTDGQISAIPQKVESVEAILNLRQKLMEQGIQDDNLDEHIKKSSNALAKGLNNLISGQAEVKINGETLSLGNEIQKKLLENNKPLKLEHIVGNSLRDTPPLGLGVDKKTGSD